MLEILPLKVQMEIEALGGFARIGELHLRAGRDASVTVDGKNRRINYRATREELDNLLHAACGGSIYAYRDSIREGYVTLDGGVRMGLAGRAVTEGEKVVAVTELSSLCFRIPHHIVGVAADMYDIWSHGGRKGGIVVIAPPGCGKTTFLRDFIIRASSGVHALRVAVVDSREELCPAKEGEMVDVLCGYPRAAGLEIALRTLSPEVLVCDEIGAEEIVSMREILHGGVPLVGAMHGASLTDVMRRPGGRALMESQVFVYAVTLSGGAGNWMCDICEVPC